MSFGDGSILDLVAEPHAVLLVGQIDVISSRQDVDEQVETGVIELRVLREISRTAQLGETGVLRVQFMRYKQPLLRLREGQRGFNGIELAEGRVLLAGFESPPSTSKSQWGRNVLVPTVVATLSSQEDPLVAGVEGALAIEREKNPEVRLELLQRGLSGGQEFLVEYCHYAMGRLARIPRKDAVHLEIDVLQGANSKPGERAMAQTTLELELWRDNAPDDALNKKILAGFFGALMMDEPELRSHLVTALFEMLQGDSHGTEATRYRETLMQGIALPSSNALPRVLRQVARDDESVAQEAMWLSKFVSPARAR